MFLQQKFNPKTETNCCFRVPLKLLKVDGQISWIAFVMVTKTCNSSRHCWCHSSIPKGHAFAGHDPILVSNVIFLFSSARKRKSSCYQSLPYFWLIPECTSVTHRSPFKPERCWKWSHPSLERDLLLVIFRAQTLSHRSNTLPLYVRKNPLAFQSQKSIVDGNPCIHMIYKKLSSYNTVAIDIYP